MSTDSGENDRGVQVEKKVYTVSWRTGKAS